MVANRANTLPAGRFDARLAYSSTCSAELPLRPSAIAAPPLSPRLLHSRLCRSGVRRWVVSRVNGFECPASYFSDCNVVLPLSPSARAAPPSEPSLFFERLRAQEQGRVLRAVNGR